MNILDLHQSHLNCFKRGYNLTTVVWKFLKLNSFSVCCCCPHTWDVLLQVSIRVRLIRSNTMSGFFSLNSPQGQLQGNLYTVVCGWANLLWNLPVTLLTILCTVGLLFLRYLTYSKVTFALHSFPCWDCFSPLSLSLVILPSQKLTFPVSCLISNVVDRESVVLCIGLLLACVASISLWFWSKEQGTRVKDRMKNEASKRAGRGFANKPQDFKNRPLDLAWLTACTNIWCCHQLS